MTIEHVFDTITLILNKNRRGFVKTSQKVTAVTAAMYDYFAFEVEQYRKTGFTPAAVKKFVKPATLTLTNGMANLPTDFVQEVTFETSCGSQGVFLTPEEFKDRVHSSILDPDQQNPIAKIENDKIVVAPDEFTDVSLIYFRIPNEFVYAVTVSGDGRSETFDEGSSTDMEFSLEDSGDIIRRALLYLGVAFQNQEALQLAVNDNTK
jgi:hypothetical protein